MDHPEKRIKGGTIVGLVAQPPVQPKPKQEEAPAKPAKKGGKK